MRFLRLGLEDRVPDARTDLAVPEVKFTKAKPREDDAPQRGSVCGKLSCCAPCPDVMTELAEIFGQLTPSKKR